jgi:hypothetical protein
VFQHLRLQEYYFLRGFFFCHLCPILALHTYHILFTHRHHTINKREGVQSNQALEGRRIVKMDSAALATANNTVNYPSLKLIPLSISQCASALKKIIGAESANEDYIIPPAVEKIERKTMILKLCNESDDVVDVDNESSGGLVPTRYARVNDDGNFSCELKLGRSEFSSIQYNKVSRALCDIGITRAASKGEAANSNIDITVWVKMRKAVGQHAVYLDGSLISEQVGEPFLVNDGAIISLYGPTGFAYRVEIIGNGANVNRIDCNNASKKRGATTNNDSNKRIKHQGVKQDAHQLFENTSECPLCYELLVRTIAIHPCGHNFCEECADEHLASINCAECDEQHDKRKTACPICREQICGFTRNRAVDTMIWAAALTGCFDRDDAISYLQRREEAMEGVPSEEQKECILRCGEGEQDGIMSGSRMNGLVFRDPTSSSSTTIYVPTMPPLFPLSTTVQHQQAKATRSLSNNQEVVDLTV